MLQRNHSGYGTTLIGSSGIGRRWLFQATFFLLIVSSFSSSFLTAPSKQANYHSTSFLQRVASRESSNRQLIGGSVSLSTDQAVRSTVSRSSSQQLVPSAPTLYPSRSSRSSSPFWKSSLSLSGSESSDTDEASNMPTSGVVRESTASEFREKTVFLSGATGGLGRALALQLAKYCQVKELVLSARRQDALNELVEECSGDGGSSQTRFHTIVCDLSDPKQVQDAATKASELTKETGGIDILINNGGVSSRSRFLDTVIDVDSRIMQINFLSGAALAKVFVPGMVQNGFGRIIWISSVQGLLGIPNRSSYAASKFAVQGYCESIRAELSSSGVSVHTVSPGYIRTNLSLNAITGSGSSYGKMDETTASGADPTDVAVYVLDQVSAGKNEMVVAANASAQAAIWLRFFCPSVLQKILVGRYEKSERSEKTSDEKSKVE